MAVVVGLRLAVVAAVVPVAVVEVQACWPSWVRGGTFGVVVWNPVLDRAGQRLVGQAPRTVTLAAHQGSSRALPGHR